MRAAVVGGGAYAIGKRSARKQDATSAGIEDAQAQAQQAQQMAGQAMAAAPQAAPSAGLSDENIEKLQKIAGLRDAGVLTDAEFEKQKQEILGE